MTVFTPFKPAIETEPTKTELRNSLVMLGVPIDNLTMIETLGRIEQFVEVGRQTGRTHQVATVNTDFLVKSVDNLELRELLQRVDMCTADGMPLVWGSKLLGTPLKERVAGSDMVPLLAKLSAEKNLSLYFMGAAPGVAAEAATLLTKQYPKINIVGVSAPFWTPGEEMDSAILDDIKTSKPDILLVALGNPKQEMWIETYGEEVGVPVMIGVGASFDFIVGTTKRAPAWMQKSGLEWLSRLTQEPTRLWRRYTSNFIHFGPQLVRQWWTMRGQANLQARGCNIEVRAIGNTTILNLSGCFDHNQCRTLIHRAEQALERRPDLTLNLAEVTRLDGAAIGTFMALRTHVEDSGGTLRMVGIGGKIGRVLTHLNMTQFFSISDQNLIQGCQY